MMMIVMMVAVAWNILLPLLLMFVIIWPKGLSNAQICSKSAETVCRVQKCPANQTEWDKAARRKDCSEIQKYNNCAKVEYHCLVNEFRNETIEVCTVLRHLQGYCPIYAENKAKNDYKKKCANQTPCNCSSGYLSTEAYKWQCCYSGINNDQDVKLFPNNYCRGKTIPAHSDKDQSNNLRVEVWLPPLLIAALVVLVGCSCVCYRMKRQNKTFLEALKIWENIPCTSLRSLQLDYRKKDRIDALERTPLQIEEKNTPFTGTTEVDGSKPEIQEALTPDGDSSNQGMSTSMTQEEIMSLNSETHVLGASSEKEVAKSLTSALPNEEGSKQGMPVSDAQNKIKTPSVFETSAKKDSKLSTPESPNRDSSNQGMSASDTIEKIVTPVLKTSAKEDSESSMCDSPNKDSSNQGISESDTLEKIVTPVLETSVKEDSKSSTSESPIKDCSNQGMSASDTLEKIVTPVLETSVKEASKSSMSESPNKDSSNQGMSASDTLEQIVTPVLETSAKEDSKSSTSESPDRDSSNLGMSVLDTPYENGSKPRTSASKTTAGDISQSEIPETVLRERVEKMQKEMKDLKKLIDLIYGKGIWDLDFKLKCADRKIITMEKMMFEDVECADTADLKTKATEVENKLRPLLQKLQEIGHGLGKTDDKLLHPLHNNQIEDEPEPEEEASESPAASNAMETVENWVDEDMHFPDDKKYKKDDEAQKWKAEDLATQEQFLKSYMKKKKGKDSLLLDVSDYTNGASSNNGKNIKDDKKELASEEKPFIKKLDDLMVQTEKLLWDVAKLRKGVDKFLSPGLLDAIEEGLNEVEANIDILSESYHLSDVRTRRPHISREKKLAELYKLYGDVKEKYYKLKRRVG